MSEELPVPEPRYAGFWMRLLAIALDALIASPVILLHTWVQRRDRLLVSLTSVASYGLTVYMFVLLVKWRGGSPGKLLSGLRIVTTDFKPLGWKEVWLREGVGLGIGLLSSAVYFIALARLSQDEFFHLTLLDRARRLDVLGGIAMKVTTWLSYGWDASELIVLLTNRKRRALHDFIAGTVVIRKGKTRGALLGGIAVLGYMIVIYAFFQLNRVR
jgi:uncharacterized RDD family membrane protein YckC